MEQTSHEKCCKKHGGCGNVSSGLYFVAFVGAAIYFIQQADTFWQGVWGIIKALVWPAFIAYHLLGFLGI